ncbi:MAG: hypothetical protein JXB23_13000 [Candidatus Aminicenantes bacterium]|nr:hypothetical protein [Candidatus Aminicenantes bacterium]
MAEPILHKSPPKESNKTESSPDSEIRLNECRHQSPGIMEPIHDLDQIPLQIRDATVCYLSEPANHFVGILEETVSNLTRLHDWLSKIERTMVKGGRR